MPLPLKARSSRRRNRHEGRRLWIGVRRACCERWRCLPRAKSECSCCICLFVRAEGSNVVDGRGRAWCAGWYGGCRNEMSKNWRRDAPTRYILTLSFLHHCLIREKAPCCNPAVSTSSSHCTKPRKPSRDSCEPGEDLANPLLGIGSECDWLSLWEKKA